VDFDRQMARHKDAVYRQVVRVCGNYDDAEDVLAETLLAAYRSMHQVREEEAMRAWLATIGRRICRRMRQREALAPILALDNLPEPVAAQNPLAELEMQEMKSCVRSALDALPEHYRAVYELRDLQGLSGEDTAQRLGISLPNMKSRLNRARQIVRKHLDDGICGESSSWGIDSP
jgi:RNA polymerase sigma-70 factor, ECF subfamily